MNIVETLLERHTDIYRRKKIKVLARQGRINEARVLLWREVVRNAPKLRGAAETAAFIELEADPRQRDYLLEEYLRSLRKEENNANVAEKEGSGSKRKGRNLE